jgi:hypothetical protein
LDQSICSGERLDSTQSG